MHPRTFASFLFHLLLIALASWCGLASSPAIAETVTYYYTNPQGTVLATTDVAGNLLTTSDYRPYGTQALGSPVPGPGYTGHVNDPDSGLVYMQARYYDPAIGRFQGVDSVAPSAGAIENFNRYVYTKNNPVNHTDPDGRCVEDLCVVEGGVVISAGAVYVTAGALITIGACVTACEKVQESIAHTTKSIYDHIVHNESKDSQRPTKTPNTGQPGSRYKNPGSGQEREYGEDGLPLKDIDYDHDHGQGTPHVHDWNRDSNGNPVRGPGRPPDPKTEPHITSP